MTLDVVNAQNEAVGSIELSDEVFGGRIRTALIWESVVHQNASERQGTHATKTRGRVSGSGKKPWRQKGTGRARAGETRNPIWRAGGTVFGPQPRSYAYQLPRKVARAALRSALAQKLRDGVVTVVERDSVLSLDEPRTKTAAQCLETLGVGVPVLLVDRAVDTNLALAVRNLPRVSVAASGQVTARDVAGAKAIVMSRAALEHLSEVVAP